MPALSNQRHEAFAQALFKGATAIAAYERAGYKANRSHASRLVADGNVKARLAELQAAAAKKAVDHISFDAVDMFCRLELDIADAKTAGDHASAIKGRLGMLGAFGFLDSPTLTHEHVRGKKLDAAEEKAVEREQQTNVVRFGKVLGELRKRMGTG